MTQLYKNGTIITMNNHKTAQCAVVENGVIAYVGSEGGAASFAPQEVVDLKGATLLPAFIDPHSHIGSYAKLFSVAELSGAKTIADIVQILQQYKQTNGADEHQLIVGFGYDNNFLKEKRHPTAEELNAIKNPVLITHKSGHMGVLNSRALAEFGITKDTPAKSGGVIGKTADGELNGYLEETAFMEAAAKVPTPSAESLVQFIKRGQQLYASYGIATAQDGAVKAADWDVLEMFAQQRAFYMDVVAYVLINDSKHLVDNHYKNYKTYNNGLRIGGYKLFLDGSPQGRTAWMREAYADDNAYFGYPIYKDEEVRQFFSHAIEEGMQILVHCNGDAACEQMLRCYEQALCGRVSTLRPVMVHAQLLQKDQLQKTKQLGIVTSFFAAHCKYWADIHIKNFGKTRGENISPVRSAAECGIVYTMHQDSPVIAPNMLETVQAAVTRTSINGTLLNQAECVSVYDALAGVTCNAAYQYFEEDTKGSIEVGKRADFVVLSKNPLDVPADTIEQIEVLKTIKDGMVIFER